MKFKRFLSMVCMFALVVSLLAGCGGGQEAPAAEEGGEAAPVEEASNDGVSQERKETLIISGVDWASPSSFNFLNGSGSWPVNNTANMLVYESLFMYNGITEELEPLLADSYEWTDELTVVVKMTDKATFRDGEPVTAHDFEWSVMAAWGEDGYTAPWNALDDSYEYIKALDDYTIEAKMKPEMLNRFVMENMLSTTPVLPMHVWKALEEENGGDRIAVQQLFNEDPIGSGPYSVESYSDERTTCVRNENYWGVERFGKLAAPKKVVYVPTGNDNGQIMFEAGDLDYTENFTVGFGDLKAKGLPVSSYVEEAPFMTNDSMPTIMMGLHQPGLNNKEVRRALAHTIDYNKLAVVAMGGYSETIIPGLYANLGIEQNKVDVDAIKDLQWSFDLDKANAILDELGAERGEDGIRVLPDGTRLGPWKITCPAGWTDWEASIEIFAQSAQKAGIDIIAEGLDWGVWNDALQTGNFELSMNTYAANTRAGNWWLRASQTMSDVGQPALGEVAFNNYGRYSNPRATELILAIPQTTDEAEIKAMYTELNEIYLEDVITIPLMYRPIFFAFRNASVWEGFATEEDKVQPYIFEGAGIRNLYMIEAK